MWAPRITKVIPCSLPANKRAHMQFTRAQSFTREKHRARRERAQDFIAEGVKTMTLRLLLQSSSMSLVAFTKLKKFDFLLAPNLIQIPKRTLGRTVCTKMAAESSPSQFTHTISLPTQLGEAVQIVAAPCVSELEFRTAIESSLFQQWLKNMQTDTGVLANGAMSLKRVLIQGVDMFGKRIGFLKFKADVVDSETGKKVPGIVFARGPAVAVLILLESEGEIFAVLTEQVRVPVGRITLELPAGMLDDDKGNFVGTAVREVEEETGICLNLEDMIDLTAFLDPSTGGRVFPSPGGCDEDISLFLYRGHVDKEIITQLQGKETGLREHGELIKVRVVPYEKLWRLTADAKTLIAIALYEMAKREGMLPPKSSSVASSQ